MAAIKTMGVFGIEKAAIKLNDPVLDDGPKRVFVREELLVVPPDTKMPPANAVR